MIRDPQDDPVTHSSASLLDSWPAAMVAAAALVLLVHQGTLIALPTQFAPGTREVAAVSEVQALIRERWVEEPESGQLLDGAIRGMVGTLDPFSDYYSAEQKEAFNQQTSGSYGGLGIWINVDLGHVIVIAPIEDSPAWEAGLLPGDRIVAVDGRPTEFANTDEAARSLKGDVGSPVVLTVVREGERHPLEIEVVRAAIQIHSVKGARLLDEERKVGYLRITTFNAATAEDFRAAIDGLLARGTRALILDLRGNPGGYFDQAAEVADAWLPEDALLVTTRSRNGGELRETRAQEAQLLTVPTAILIDRGSASASEILGGALQDHGVATLVGERSYGKGSVQSIIPIQAGRADLKLTTQHYYTPKGRRIHRGDLPEEDPTWGLVPDLRVPVDLKLRRELIRRASDEEVAELKRKANGEPAAPGDDAWLQREDPQVRAAFVHLLGQLGDEVPEELAAAEERAAEERAAEERAAEERAAEERAAEERAAQDAGEPDPAEGPAQPEGE